MNILIVNFDKCYNHGGVLQAWALQHVLLSMGHNVVKAEVPQASKYPSHKLRIIWHIVKRIRRKYIIGDKTLEIFKEIRENNLEYQPNYKVMQFIQKHLNTITVTSMSELNEKDYDAVIVGSDQVWRKRYSAGQKLLTNESACDNAFLAFTNGWNCKRISYAASIGVDYWEYTEEETKVLQELIRKFDAISVREDSAVELLHRHLDPSLKIEHVLDPTLLIEKEDYIQLYQEKKEQSHNNEILVYILDQSEEKDNIVSYAQECTGLKTFRVNNPRYFDRYLPPKKRTQTSITSWLRGFHDAEIVITDSFHACVFSIIFEKPFFVILNEVRGTTRIHSLLKIFGLQSRIIHYAKDFHTLNNDIDLKMIRKIKKEWQEKSLSFINNALNGHQV